MHRSRKGLWLVAGTGALAVAGLVLHAPVPQDLRYHAFADQRNMLGVPHFWNVVSNLPFVLVGVAGLCALHKSRLPGVLRPLHSAYVVFFVAAILVGIGSAYYHLNPNNDSLLWDRLPMTLGFMAFAAIVIGEHIDPELARRLLALMIFVGVGSVLYWALTEAQGHGDLRPYAAVQFLPLVLIPVVLVSLPSVFSSTLFIWLVLLSYVSAKLLELLDKPTFRILGVISGHALKHVLAALGMYFVVLAMRHRHVVRNPREAPNPRTAL